MRTLFVFTLVACGRVGFEDRTGPLRLFDGGADAPALAAGAFEVHGGYYMHPLVRPRFGRVHR